MRLLGRRKHAVAVVGQFRARCDAFYSNVFDPVIFFLRVNPIAAIE